MEPGFFAYLPPIGKNVPLLNDLCLLTILREARSYYGVGLGLASLRLINFPNHTKLPLQLSRVQIFGPKCILKIRPSLVRTSIILC